MTTKRQRLINMRECLRQVQRILPEDTTYGVQFICLNVDYVNSNEQAKYDTKAYVMQALGENQNTFNGALLDLNKRTFTGRQLMTLRRQWIDQLCDRISIEIGRTPADGPRA